jgi:sarcosine oxidase/L-pipecolate oxidase
MASQSASRGIQFISGASGHARSLVFDETNSCTGVSNVDGTVYFADHIILAAGADTESLLDMEGQQSAVGNTVCLVQLTSEDAKLYKDMVLFANIEEGPVS